MQKYVLAFMRCNAQERNWYCSRNVESLLVSLIASGVVFFPFLHSVRWRILNILGDKFGDLNLWFQPDMFEWMFHANSYKYLLYCAFINFCDLNSFELLCIFSFTCKRYVQILQSQAGLSYRCWLLYTATIMVGTVEIRTTAPSSLRSDKSS